MIDEQSRDDAIASHDAVASSPTARAETDQARHDADEWSRISLAFMNEYPDLFPTAAQKRSVGVGNAKAYIDPEYIEAMRSEALELLGLKQAAEAGDVQDITDMSREDRRRALWGKDAKL